MNKINMHIHTNASDGIYDYKKVILESIKSGLEVISITDHDNVEKLQEILAFANKKNIQIIYGVELTANYPNGICHILGYNIDIEKINEFNKYIKNNRIKKAKKIIYVLNKMGYDINYDEVLKSCCNEVVGRRDIAKFLVLKRYFDTEDLAIKELFAKGKAAYFETKSKSIQECVDVIKKSGGLAIIAHPWTLNLSIEKLQEFIIKYNFDGIEVYNHKILYDRYEELNKLANSLNIYKTCGTDYHGKADFNDLVVEQDVDCSKILNKIIVR